MQATADSRGRLVPRYLDAGREPDCLESWRVTLDVWRSWRAQWDLAEMDAELTIAERAVERGERFEPTYQRRLERAARHFVASLGRDELSRFTRELRAASWQQFKRSLGSKLFGWLPSACGSAAAAASATAAATAAEEEDDCDEAAAPTCVICLGSRATVAAVPCGHLSCCEPCARAAKFRSGSACFACRRPVRATLRVFY